MRAITPISAILLISISTSLFISSISASSLSVPDAAPHKRDDDVAGPNPQLGLSTISFPTSCRPETASTMNQAIHALHSFWYSEAQRLFQAVLDQDRLCAIAYWGIAMSQWRPLFHPVGITSQQEMAADDALQRAHTLLVGGQDTPAQPVNVTQRERDYINAASALFLSSSSSSSYSDRALAYEQQMRLVFLRHQEADKEVVPFYALAIAACGAADPTHYTVDTLKAGKTLELLLLDYPYHPGGLNYLVHVYSQDLGQAQDTIPDAVRFQESSLGGAYPLYAPTKIFNYVGYWSHALVSSTRAVAAAQLADSQAYPEGYSTDDYMNALSARVYALLQQCQDGEVEQVVRQIEDDLKPLSSEIAARTLALTLGRYFFETERWQRASLFDLKPSRFAWSEHSWSRMFKYYVRVMGWVMINNMDEMLPNLYELQTAKQEWDADVEGKAALDPKWRGTLERMYASAIVWTDWMKSVRDSEAGEGEIEAVRDRLIERMRAVSESEGGADYPEMLLMPMDESTGNMLLMMDRRRTALGEFEKSLSKLPYRFHGFFGATKAACLLYIYGESGLEKKQNDEEAKYKCKVYHRLLHSLCHPARDENHCGERPAYVTLNSLMDFVDEGDPTTGDGDNPTTTGPVMTTGVTTDVTTAGVTTGTVETGPSPEEIRAAKVRKLVWMIVIVAGMSGALAAALFAVQWRMRRNYEIIGN